MYIEPNTIIRILKNCPLDTTYDHTLYFDDSDAQYNYFLGLTKYTLTKQTYQRVNRSRMRVQYKADDLYDCNYIMFQNSSFGSKWFYAFIKSVEYVNNVTSEIEYEIDVMQTWAFDYQLGQSFVEREHSATDVPGDNLVPEKIEHGEYVSNGFNRTHLLDTSIVVACTFDNTYQDIDGTFYSGVFCGLALHTFPNTISGAQQCVEFIHNAGAKTDGIVSVGLMPTNFITKPNEEAKRVTTAHNKNMTLLRADGTPIKNKKLLTYPYNFLYVTNCQGTGVAYLYEYFDTDNCTFELVGDMSPNPGVWLVPSKYKGAELNYDEKMVLTGFPQLPYNVDSYKQWLAQSGTSFGLNAVTTAVGAGMRGFASAGPAGAALGVGVSVATSLVQLYEHSIVPNQAKGGGSPITQVAAHIFDFGVMQKHIQPEFATIIDDYFTVYGYATHRTKIPNRAVRPHWTYTKTIGCVVHGSVPADDISKICHIYNNGITFWKNGNEVGNYSLDNSV